MIEKNYGKYMPAGGLDPHLIEAVSTTDVADRKTAIEASAGHVKSIGTISGRCRCRRNSGVPAVVAGVGLFA
jgi:hypothetical protein